MLCINNSNTDAYFNIAAEEYLLKNFTEDVFMLWQNEPSVIIGKHQDIWAEMNQEFVEERDIKVVRRYTGGGAVYHDLGNMNITFIENSHKADFDKFRIKIQKFLQSIGIHTDTDERRALTIDGLKISGSAQCIYKMRMMYHCTLLYSSNLTDLTLALENKGERAEQEIKYVKSKRSPVTNIRDHMTSCSTVDSFKSMILSHFMVEDKQNKDYVFNDNDIKSITQLSKNKYATTGWNFNKK